MSRTRPPRWKDRVTLSLAYVPIIVLFLFFPWNGAAYGAGVAAQPEAGTEGSSPGKEKGIQGTANSPLSATGAGADEYGDVTEGNAAGAKSDEYGNVEGEDAASGEGTVSDPIEPWNRAMFQFNDKLYFWALKPAAKGYAYVVPEDVRYLFINFYLNIRAPVRIVNNLLQGEVRYAGIELGRFLINSTAGVAGLRDCAKECFGIVGRDADFGQTMGRYGVGPGFYIVWPFIGPSNPRDSVGWVADRFLMPTSYVSLDPDSQQLISPLTVALYAHDRINYVSFHIGDYEMIKAAAIDPYVAIRDAYAQSRRKAIEKK